MKNKLSLHFDIKMFINKILSVRLIFRRKTLTLILHYLWNITTFAFLLTFFMIKHFIDKLNESKLFTRKNITINSKYFNNSYDRVITLFDRYRDPSSISRSELMEIAVRNMEMKKTRSMITIGGMALGIGAIVFLVSIGYGLQNLVISRVARLEEMRQVEIAPQTGSKLLLNDKLINQIQKMKNVQKVLPVIGVVARVSYKLSVSDLPAYGVTSEYLIRSAIKPVKGSLFKSNHLQASLQSRQKQVLGAKTEEEYTNKQKVVYSIYPEKWVPVYTKPSESGGYLVGYTRRIPGITIGKIYRDTDETMWINANYSIWERSQCNGEQECEKNTMIPKLDEVGTQKSVNGYVTTQFVDIRKITSDDVLMAKSTSGMILGTSSATLAESNSASGSSILDINLESLIASEAGTLQTEKVQKVKLGNDAYKLAIVNRAMLKVLNIPEDKAVGKKFSVSYVVTGDLVKKGYKLESESADYTIVGVIPSDKTPFFYVPLIDLRSLGINVFSQTKIIVVDQKVVAEIRKNIESLGLSTVSVIDTVSQINNLFSSITMILALLGTIALAVASLGMFNTLTISLLERTHEVGLMKAMGMKSYEVQELFLTESMVMGVSGGVVGLAIGIISGKIAGLLISIISVTRGAGYMDISSVPLPFIILILLLSIIVGFGTGIFPARRAKKISALNALRYE